MAKSPRVFMMTSSMVTRSVCTGPAGSRLYMSCSCCADMASCAADAADMPWPPERKPA